MVECPKDPRGWPLIPTSGNFLFILLTSLFVVVWAILCIDQEILVNLQIKTERCNRPKYTYKSKNLQKKFEDMKINEVSGMRGSDMWTKLRWIYGQPKMHHRGIQSPEYRNKCPWYVVEFMGYKYKSEWYFQIQKM